MLMKIALITGVSKGLGESVATFLLESQINVIGLSRTENDRLKQIAEENNVTYNHYQCDLSEIANVEKALDIILERITGDHIAVIYVVNNAATLSPINPANKVHSDELQYHYNVNAITPMIILNRFLNEFSKKQTMVIGVNVTSGAAQRPIFGWSAYCSSKASIDMYTKTVALEEENLKTGHKIINFNPGVMDTSMQEQIRSTDETSFKDVEVFRSYKKNNILNDTDIVAGILVDIITDEVSIENGKTYDVKDYF